MSSPRSHSPRAMHASPTPSETTSLTFLLAGGNQAFCKMQRWPHAPGPSYSNASYQITAAVPKKLKREASKACLTKINADVPQCVNASDTSKSFKTSSWNSHNTWPPLLRLACTAATINKRCRNKKISQLHMTCSAHWVNAEKHQKLSQLCKTPVKQALSILTEAKHDYLFVHALHHCCYNTFQSL